MGGIGGAAATNTGAGTGSVSVDLNADNEVIPDLTDTWVPPADVEAGRLCPNNCKEFIRTSGIPLTSPLLVNATKVGASDAGDIYCICPCSDNNCVALAGGGCSCLDAEPPNLFETGAEPDEIDPNNPPFDNLTGPGFFK